MRHHPFIYSLFKNTLLADEDIYWFGEPKFNIWHLRGRDIMYLLLSLFIFMPLILTFIMIAGVIYILFMARRPEYLLGILGLPIIAYLASFVFSWISHLLRENLTQHRKVSNGYLDEPSQWWRTTYYAITSHRVLIFEQGQIRDYWYILLDKPILSKNKRGTANIQLYSKHFVAKKQHTPLLDSLRQLHADEAEEAMNILEQAYEEALNTRARKMGLAHG